MADNPLNLEKMLRGSQNLDVWDAATNGDEDTDWTNLVGDKGPSLKKAIKTIMSKAPINSTPFATKSALLADTTLADGAFAFVYNDTAVNNGSYQKVSGAWQYLKYNKQYILKTTGNLYSSQNQKSGNYIVINSGQFNAYSDAIVAYFAIDAGKTYAIKSASFDPSYFTIMLKADDIVGTGTGTNVTNQLVATSDNTVKTLTIPSDSTAKFAMLNVRVGSSFDIQSSLVVNDGNSITDTSASKSEIISIDNHQLRDDVARQLISELQTATPTATQASILTGKNWVVVGDSITEHNSRTNKNYHDYVSDLVGGLVVYNYGQSGTGYYHRYNVADTITQNPDYVTVFFGTNDWQNSDPNNTKLLGQFGDTTSDTVAGCVYITLSKLVAKFYSKRIAVFTPLPRSDNWGSKAAANSRGFTLEQVADVIKKTAAHLSIPCLDLYHQSNLPVYDYSGSQYYFTAPGQGSSDGLHPNDAGHQVIAAKVKAFLESI